MDNLLVLLGLLFAYWRWREDRNDRRRSLAASTAAELTALHEIIDRREYLHYMKLIEESGGIPTIPVRDREVLPIYAANMNSIGLLGTELCDGLARHYSLCHAFLDQNQVFITEPDPDNWPPETLTEYRREHLRMAEDIHTIQVELIGPLREMASEKSIVDRIREPMMAWSGRPGAD